MCTRPSVAPRHEVENEPPPATLRRRRRHPLPPPARFNAPLRRHQRLSAPHRRHQLLRRPADAPLPAGERDHLQLAVPGVEGIRPGLSAGRDPARHGDDAADAGCPSPPARGVAFAEARCRGLRRHLAAGPHGAGHPAQAWHSLHRLHARPRADRGAGPGTAPSYRSCRGHADGCLGVVAQGARARLRLGRTDGAPPVGDRHRPVPPGRE